MHTGSPQPTNATRDAHTTLRLHAHLDSFVRLRAHSGPRKPHHPAGTRSLGLATAQPPTTPVRHRRGGIVAAGGDLCSGLTARPWNSCLFFALTRNSHALLCMMHIDSWNSTSTTGYSCSDAPDRTGLCHPYVNDRSKADVSASSSAYLSLLLQQIECLNTIV